MRRLSRTTVSNLKNNPIKVLQFGSGNFLRGFADWIIDVMNEKGVFQGDVEIVQSVSSSKENHIQLQDGLYHVATRGLVNDQVFDELRLITSVVRAFNAGEEPQQFYSAAANPDLRFVISNTTEAGIIFIEEPYRAGGVPGSFPGKLTVLLYERFKAQLNGVIVLPCELIEKNGTVLRDQVIRYIRFWNLPGEFERWVNEHCFFCNTLVDRIVPGASKYLSEEIAAKTGYVDEIPVSVEPYYLWAIEGPAFVREEFPAEACGLTVRFVNDLDYYRERKVRILNGGHTALMPVAYLRGFRTVKECLSNEDMKSFIYSVLFEEVIPAMKGDHSDLRGFAKDVLQRFANPFVEHKLVSIALNSIPKFKVRLLPTIIEYYKATGHVPEYLAHAFAALIVFYRGYWRGEAIPVNDDASIIEFFNIVWNGERHSLVKSVLSNHSLWQRDLTQLPGLVNAVSDRLEFLLSSE